MLTLAILTALVLCVGNVSNAVYMISHCFSFLHFIIQKDISYSMNNKHIRPKWLGSMRWKGTDCTSESRPTPAAESYMHLEGL